jgi:hypothetical protein
MFVSAARLPGGITSESPRLLVTVPPTAATMRLPPTGTTLVVVQVKGSPEHGDGKHPHVPEPEDPSAEYVPS